MSWVISPINGAKIQVTDASPLLKIAQVVSAPVDASMVAEIKRKASLGIPLTTVTVEKQKIYDSITQNFKSEEVVVTGLALEKAEEPIVFLSPFGELDTGATNQPHPFANMNLDSLGSVAIALGFIFGGFKLVSVLFGGGR